MDVNNNGQFFLCGLQECSSRKIHLHLTNLHEMESYSLKEYTYTNFKKSHLFLLLLPCGYVSFLLFERAGDFTLVKCGKTKQNKRTTFKEILLHFLSLSQCDTQAAKVQLEYIKKYIIDNTKKNHIRELQCYNRWFQKYDGFYGKATSLKSTNSTFYSEYA